MHEKKVNHFQKWPKWRFLRLIIFFGCVFVFLRLFFIVTGSFLLIFTKNIDIWNFSKMKTLTRVRLHALRALAPKFWWGGWVDLPYFGNFIKSQGLAVPLGTIWNYQIFLTLVQKLVRATTF